MSQTLELTDDTMVCPALFPAGGTVGIDTSGALVEDDALVVAFYMEEGDIKMLIPIYLPIDAAQLLIADITTAINDHLESNPS